LHIRLAAQPEEHVVPGPELPEDAHGVSTALAHLGERDRELLTLIAWDGLSPAEAAQALSVSQTTLRVRLHRARRRFTALLSEVGEVGEVGDTYTYDHAHFGSQAHRGSALGESPRSVRTAPLGAARNTTSPGGH
jgi:predicted DNA-binding protein (UPF0251 family)